jgi:hypothetical protein
MDGIEYAFARIAARHGQRPGAAQWHRIEHARTFAALQDATRGTPLERLTGGLAPDADAHAVEARLRRQWRALVDEVASWMPDAWRGAVLWCAVVPDLAVLAHAARNGPRWSWMDDDALYRDLAFVAPSATSPFAPLAGAWSAPETLGAAWHREFRGRVPPAEAGPLPELERSIAKHLAAFAESDVDDGTALRRRFDESLAALFRRAVLTPAAAFAFLAMALVDLERLRGEILRRVVFPRRGLGA